MRTVAERFWAKVRKGSECWVWTGAKAANGYGSIRITDGPYRSRAVLAHRWAYENLVGPIPEGLAIDHLCRNKACVNPSHLEAVTQRENVLRGVGIPAVNAARTRCIRGHPLSGDNLALQRGGKARKCRACAKRRREEFRARTGR